jgi:hypothetical protein
MKKTVLMTLTLSALLSANPYQDAAEELNSAVETGKKVASTLVKKLGSNLKKHMKSGGPSAALRFCSENAFPLTQDVSDASGNGITVKRISLKFRNPANAPETDAEKSVLESLQTLQENGVILPEYLIEKSDEDTYKFYKPLSINKGVCLKCHGDLSKTPKLASEISTIYPEDKATGYRKGDLRGAIVVTIKK